MPRTATRIFCWTAVALTVGLVLMLAAVPPVSRDALNHHLLVPKRYLAAGAIHQIPEVPFSYYPMNLEMLYLGALWLGSDILPKYIHFAFALLTAISLQRFLTRRLNPAWAAVGVCLFLTLPVILRLSVTVYVDLGLIFFSWMALVHFLYWVEKGFNRRDFLISAVCCGLALGVKYNGLVTLLIMAACVPMAYARQRGAGLRTGAAALGLTGLYAAVSLLVFSPWWVRNLAWTGNPLYPLFGSLFKLITAGQPATDALAAVNVYGSGLSHFTYRTLIYGESGWGLALIPLRIFFQGADDTPRFFDGVLHPFLLVLPMVALAGIRREERSRRREIGYLLFFAVLTIMIVFLQTDMRIRYMAPAIPALVVLSVFGLRSIITALEKHWPHAAWRPALLPLVLAGLMVPNAIYAYRLYTRIDPMPLLTGRQDRESYIAVRRPEFVLLDHANRHLGPETRLLSLFLSGRHYYCDRPIREAPGILLQAVGQAASAGDVAASLKAGGYTHLVFNALVLNRWLNDNLEAAKRPVAAAFFSDWTRTVRQNKGYVLVAIKQPGDPRPDPAEDSRSPRLPARNPP